MTRCRPGRFGGVEGAADAAAFEGAGGRRRWRTRSDRHVLAAGVVVVVVVVVVAVVVQRVDAQRRRRTQRVVDAFVGRLDAAAFLIGRFRCDNRDISSVGRGPFSDSPAREGRRG